ncbi:MAG: response regulator, partial [Variovorax sp.]
MRLLLVEDDDLLGNAMHKGLVRAGYAVDWNRSGRDVLASFGSCTYDCVLLDLGLPDQTGEQLLKSIRARNFPVSVIVVTARGGIADRVRMLDMGADDYMVKPLDLDEVTSRVRAVLRRVAG